MPGIFTESTTLYEPINLCRVPLASIVIKSWITGHLWNKQYQQTMFLLFLYLMIYKSRDKQFMLAWINRFCLATQVNFCLDLFWEQCAHVNLMVLTHVLATLMTSDSKLINILQFTLFLSVVNSLHVAHCTFTLHFSYRLISPVDPD